MYTCTKKTKNYKMMTFILRDHLRLKLYQSFHKQTKIQFHKFKITGYARHEKLIFYQLATCTPLFIEKLSLFKSYARQLCYLDIYRELFIISSLTLIEHINCHTTLLHSIQFVYTAWCVIGPTVFKNKHSMLKYFSMFFE